jgi:hypothetical protein
LASVACDAATPKGLLDESEDRSDGYLAEMRRVLRVLGVLGKGASIKETQIVEHKLLVMVPKNMLLGSAA